jgi:hypothetical protein
VSVEVPDKSSRDGVIMFMAKDVVEIVSSFGSGVVDIDEVKSDRVVVKDIEY